MNIYRIIFSGVVTCCIGVILGFGMAEINRDDTRSQAPYQYATVGAIMGLAIGSGQEALRQLEHQSEDV